MRPEHVVAIDAQIRVARLRHEQFEGRSYEAKTLTNTNSGATDIVHLSFHAGERVPDRLCHSC